MYVFAMNFYILVGCINNLQAYSGNGGITMVTKDPAYNSLIGQAGDVSFYDAMFVNSAYNCTGNLA